VTDHHPTAHQDAHAILSDDDHGHAEPRLGPIDWLAWSYAFAGAALGLLVAALLYLKVAGA
jgi:hypothetical protein